MKVLVATGRTQGSRADDLHWGVDGELVWIAEVCATDRRGAGKGCGCGRAFAGVVSHRAGTTAEVRDIPAMTMQEYEKALAVGLAEAGWPASLAPQMARDQARFAADWDEGVVLERNLDTFTERVVDGLSTDSAGYRT